MVNVCLTLAVFTAVIAASYSAPAKSQMAFPWNLPKTGFNLKFGTPSKSGLGSSSYTGFGAPYYNGYGGYNSQWSRSAMPTIPPYPRSYTHPNPYTPRPFTNYQDAQDQNDGDDKMAVNQLSWSCKARTMEECKQKCLEQMSKSFCDRIYIVVAQRKDSLELTHNNMLKQLQDALEYILQ